MNIILLFLLILVILYIYTKQKNKKIIKYKFLSFNTKKQFLKVVLLIIIQK